MLFQMIRYRLCNQLSALIEYNISVKIQRIVNPVINNFAVVICLSGVGNESFNILIEEHTDNTIWSKVTVVDALFQGIGVDGISKVVNIGNFLGFFWRSSKADLRCRSEILQHLAPLAVRFGTATMTLIYNYQVKEVWTELLKQTVCILVFSS